MSAVWLKELLDLGTTTMSVEVLVEPNQEGVVAVVAVAEVFDTDAVDKVDMTPLKASIAAIRAEAIARSLDC